ncbi:cytochrome P450 [Scytonema sp. HK-05]|uniref:cytochrome P450 n=1 Tax=Scytonema sp. HK-05 TaxID=1137095 RepID=UPI000AC2DCDE|nr:cytochrome P450 [Scytonema sp. HK-05]BAY49707.1 cytochrome P450 [Scytonema sp. HK-05]
MNTPHKLSLWDLVQWTVYPANFLDACSRRYGDIFTVQLPGQQPSIFVSHPEALKDIFTAPSESFDFREGNQILDFIFREHSLLMMNGKSHLRQRKLMMPPFHGERMAHYGKLICGLTEQMMKTWSVGESVSINLCMHKITQNVLFHVVFGSTKTERSEQLRQKLLALIEMTTSTFFALNALLPPLRKDLGPWSAWGSFLRIQNELDELLYAEITERRMQPESERTDILSLLMTARDEEGQPMTNEELRDELITVLVSGYDTTSTALMWAMYWIHQTPSVRERLLKELNNIKDPSDTKAISQLPYLTATCQETLRLRPGLVVGFLRVAKTPIKMMDYELPVGSRIWPNIYSAHRREEVYPDSEKFNPERFLERHFSPYEYLPFGGGTRICIGQALANYQMKLVLFSILTRYQMTLADPRPIHPIRRGPGLQPLGNLRMIVTAQHHRQSNVPALA